MSNENSGSGPVATATPGSPIHVNVQMPSQASERDDEPSERSSKRSAKSDKQVAKESDALRNKGARSVLKGLGIPKEERDGLLKEIKETRTAKSLQEKLTGEHKARAEKAEAELKVLKAETETYAALAKQYADEQFNALPESLQKFIAATSGDDLNSRLKSIKTAKESGLISAKEAAAATAEAKSEAKPAKPANTSNAVNPKAPPPNATPTPKQQWEALKASNPRLAAQFYAANQVSIDSDWS